MQSFRDGQALLLRMFVEKALVLTGGVLNRNKPGFPHPCSSIPMSI
jgi:hypothetical protein